MLHWASTHYKLNIPVYSKCFDESKKKTKTFSSSSNFGNGLNGLNGHENQPQTHALVGLAVIHCQRKRERKQGKNSHRIEWVQSYKYVEKLFYL